MVIDTVKPSKAEMDALRERTLADFGLAEKEKQIVRTMCDTYLAEGKLQGVKLTMVLVQPLQIELEQLRKRVAELTTN